MTDPPAARAVPFLSTKEYRRFAEFCDACRRYRYIGLCHGPPGVGKTLSARQYAHWEHVEALIPWGRRREPLPVDARDYRTVFYTPSVTNSARQVAQEVQQLRVDVSELVEVSRALAAQTDPAWWQVDHTTLLMVDEADRLKLPSVEQLRDIYDRSAIGLILIGMPGLEKRIARYPQLYSRVGFVHAFRPLSAAEVQFLLAHHWQHLGLVGGETDFTDAEAVAAIVRITGGNFRLLHRLVLQIERILEINDRRTITKEVVDAARDQLVIGAV